MSKIFIGYVSGVHGLRGDLKIKNKFSRPELIFKKDMPIYLNNELHTITAAKFYKDSYLTTIDNLKDINFVEHYKGYDVFVDRESLNLKNGEYLIEDLIGLKVTEDNKQYGEVKEVLDNGFQKILVLDDLMIPLVDEYVIKVSIEEDIIECKNIGGLKK